MEQLPPTFGRVLEPGRLARALSIGEDDLYDGYPVQEVSTSVPFVMVPQKNFDALKRCKVNRDAYNELVEAEGAKSLFVFAPEPHEEGNDLAARMFFRKDSVEKDSSDRGLITEKRMEAMEAAARLRKIPNVGPTGATYLMRLSITRLEDAAGLDPYGLYQELCVMDAKQHHPCWMDVFAAVVSYANGEPARSWWEFTPQRKALQRDGRL